MSTEFDVRIWKPFSVDELRTASRRVLQDMAPNAQHGALQVRPWLGEYQDRVAEIPASPPEFMRRRHGDVSPLPDYLITTTDTKAVTGVSEVDIGHADDPVDSGRRLWVERNFHREPGSRLLGIAVATAAAQLNGGPIFDEALQLTGDRLVDPQHLSDLLRNTDAHGPFDVVAEAVLVAAGIR